LKESGKIIVSLEKKLKKLVDEKTAETLKKDVQKWRPEDWRHVALLEGQDRRKNMRKPNIATEPKKKRGRKPKKARNQDKRK